MKALNLCAGLAALVFANYANAEPASACTPTVIDLRTDFPESAQHGRLHGSVTVGVKLDAAGEVSSARLVSSSGRATLDRAALVSARRYWRFDASKCDAKDKAQEFVVGVTFERPQGVAVSGTLNRKSLARMRALEAKDSCQANRQANETMIFTCRNEGSERMAKRETEFN